jgi:hypothetical protein
MVLSRAPHSQNATPSSCDGHERRVAPLDSRVARGAVVAYACENRSRYSDIRLTAADGLAYSTRPERAIPAVSDELRITWATAWSL